MASNATPSKGGRAPSPKAAGKGRKVGSLRAYALALIISIALSTIVSNLLLSILFPSGLSVSYYLSSYLQVFLTPILIHILLIPLYLAPFVVVYKALSAGDAFKDVFSNYIHYLLAGLGAKLASTVFSIIVGVAMVFILVVSALTIIGLLFTIPLAIVALLLLSVVDNALSLIAVSRAKKGFGEVLGDSIEFITNVTYWWGKGPLKEGVKRQFVASLGLLLAIGALIGGMALGAIGLFPTLSPFYILLSLILLLVGLLGAYVYVKYQYKVLVTLLPAVR